MKTIKSFTFTVRQGRNFPTYEELNRQVIEQAEKRGIPKDGIHTFLPVIKVQVRYFKKREPSE